MQNYCMVLAAHKRVVSIFVQAKSWTLIILRRESLGGRKSMDCSGHKHLSVNSGIVNYYVEQWNCAG